MTRETMDPTGIAHDEHGEHYAWISDTDRSFHFEVDLASIDALLPRDLMPVEPVPGRAVMHVGHLHFPGPNPASPEPVLELSLALLVHPDRTDRRPLRFGFYVLNVASDRHAFLDWVTEVDHMPAYRTTGLRFDFEEESGAVSVADDHGAICELHHRPTAPVFKEGQAYAHVFTVRKGICSRSLFSWTGVRCEHQRRVPRTRLHPHPFFRGIDVTSARPYMTIFNQPGSRAVARYYRARTPVRG